jgi:hypothetical protein
MGGAPSCLQLNISMHGPLRENSDFSVHHHHHFLAIASWIGRVIAQPFVACSVRLA